MGAAPPALRRRLLQDISEIQHDPYPNIHFFIDDSDTTWACVIFTPENQPPLHLTVKFPDQYPLNPPTVRIQSYILHPNIIREYICASILNTTEGWTPVPDGSIQPSEHASGSASTNWKAWLVILIPPTLPESAQPCSAPMIELPISIIDGLKALLSIKLSGRKVV